MIKLGGSLITDKRTENTVNREAVDRVAEAIAEIVNLGYSVILVHGAGSFGHIRLSRERRSPKFEQT